MKFRELFNKDEQWVDALNKLLTLHRVLNGKEGKRPTKISLGERDYENWEYTMVGSRTGLEFLADVFETVEKVEQDSYFWIS